MKSNAMCKTLISLDMRDGRASFEPYLEVLRTLPFAWRVRVLALAPRWAGTALDATINEARES